MDGIKERLDIQTCPDLFQVALHNQRFDFALRHIGRVENALEIGTGLGGFSPRLAAACDQYTGIEFDAESARITAGRLGPNARVLQGDARQLPFEQKSFSAIVCLEVLEHLGDYRAGVRGIHKCLKDDGVAIISVPHRNCGGKSRLNPYHLYEPGERELILYFQKHFEKVDVYFQYFPETRLMQATRIFHLRKIFGFHKIYQDLAMGVADATSRLKIDAEGHGLKLHLLLVVRGPRPISLQ